MHSTTTDLVLIAALLAGFTLMGVAMLAVALRVGPKRGTWNQPAAKLRAPGRWTSVGLYITAALHVLAGIIIAVAVPGGGIAMLVLLTIVAMFYVLFAQSFAVANAVVAKRKRAERRRS